MPESCLDLKDSQCIPVECRASPQRLSSLHRNSMCASFCTEGNVQECLSHITQELSSLGLSPVWANSARHSELNVVAVLNCVYDLIQLHRRDLRALENMEVEQLKVNSSMDYLQFTSTQLKEQLELLKRENTGLHERERQLQIKVKSLQNCLKNEKDEVQKLQNIISNRAGQYNHEMKRKEREFNKLKERMNQLLSDKKDRKQAIDVLNCIGRADGKRSLWKTEKTEANDDAREKLTNGIRLQWRRLKSHVERLDSQASLVEMNERDGNNSVSRVTHEEEMHKLKMEIQQCKDFIRAQQHLLQRQLSSPCDDDVACLLNNCYMQQEKERLKGEWNTLEEQRKIFDRERNNFTEAAIRLSQERKAFEENRAMWLKYQFLNLSPFPDSNKPQISRIQSAFSILEMGRNPGPVTENDLSDASTHKEFPTTSSSTDELP
ncbi:hypothetical protein WMY93_025013 [Mugilogobius chulae]|uniref:Uncharacterized protein n=1 Tax=Mugilogobius chulae TaxID=88201 RepID=A0AAW0N4H5_9GOBI